MPSFTSGRPIRVEGSFDGDPVAAGQRQFSAATHAEAVDRRHRGATQLGQALEDLLAATDGIVGSAARVEFAELADIGTGDEPAWLQRADHDALGRIQRDAFQQRVQFQQHVLRQCIHRLPGAVQAKHQHAILACFHLPMPETEPVETVCKGVGHALAFRTKVVAIVARRHLNTCLNAFR